MLKRRSFLLLASTSAVCLLSPIGSGAAIDSGLPLSSNEDAPSTNWMAFHEAIISDARKGLREDIGRGLTPPGSVRAAECPVCFLQFSVGIDT